MATGAFLFRRNTPKLSAYLTRKKIIKKGNKSILCNKLAIVILAELLYGYNGLTRF